MLDLENCLNKKSLEGKEAFYGAFYGHFLWRFRPLLPLYLEGLNLYGFLYGKIVWIFRPPSPLLSAFQIYFRRVFDYKLNEFGETAKAQFITSLSTDPIQLFDHNLDEMIRKMFNDQIRNIIDDPLNFYDKEKIMDKLGLNEGENICLLRVGRP